MTDASPEQVEEQLKEYNDKKKVLVDKFISLGGRVEELGISSDSSLDDQAEVEPYIPGLNAQYVTKQQTTEWKTLDSLEVPPIRGKEADIKDLIEDAKLVYRSLEAWKFNESPPKKKIGMASSGARSKTEATTTSKGPFDHIEDALRSVTERIPDSQTTFGEVKDALARYSRTSEYHVRIIKREEMTEFLTRIYPGLDHFTEESKKKKMKTIYRGIACKRIPGKEMHVVLPSQAELTKSPKAATETGMIPSKSAKKTTCPAPITIRKSVKEMITGNEKRRTDFEKDHKDVDQILAPAKSDGSQLAQDVKMASADVRIKTKQTSPVKGSNLDHIEDAVRTVTERMPGSQVTEGEVKNALAKYSRSAECPVPDASKEEIMEVLERIYPGLDHSPEKHKKKKLRIIYRGITCKNVTAKVTLPSSPKPAEPDEPAKNPTDPVLTVKKKSAKKKPSTELVTLGKRLKEMFGGDEENHPGCVSHILVTNGVPDHYTDDDVADIFELLCQLDWRVLFDFDPKGRLFNYVDSRETQNLKIINILDFKPSKDKYMQDPERFEKVAKDFIEEDKKVWIVANGNVDLHMASCTNSRDWRRNTKNCLFEALQNIKHNVPRPLVVFMVLSEDHEIMQSSVEHITSAFNEWVTLAESAEFSTKWQTFLQEEIGEEDDEMKRRCIIGIPWKTVTDCLQSSTDLSEQSGCLLPTSTGQHVDLTPRKKSTWNDLDILGAIDFEDVFDDLEESDGLKFQNKTEQNFYKGGQVDWWNFHFENVLKRDMSKELLGQVEKVLTEDNTDGSLLRSITLYHQPGAGGTTVAKEMLWKFRHQYRCAIVKNVATQRTVDQIAAFHTYKDKQPNPVLLLFDNTDEEALALLKAELDEKGKQISRHVVTDSKQVFYVILFCQRQTNLPEVFDHAVEQELTLEEQKRFQDKYVELDRKYLENKQKGYDPIYLLSFNFMKSNFNVETTEDIVKNLIKDMKNPTEKTLLKYLALINAYDPLYRPVPVSGFDIFMGKQWDNKMSESMNILTLKIFKKTNGQYIRICHNILSKIILKVFKKLKHEPYTLYDICFSFLNTPGMFGYVYTHKAVDDILLILREIVKKRIRDPNTGIPKTYFSQFIQDVNQEEKDTKAENIFLNLFEISRDVFVGQQLARFYMKYKKWDLAQKCAEKMVRFGRKNSYLLDTYGAVFKMQMIHKYEEALSSASDISLSKAQQIFDLGIEAIRIFKKEQDVSETNTLEKNAIANQAGYFQEISTVSLLLDMLALVECLQQPQLHDLLVLKHVPIELSEVFGEKRLKELDGFQNNVKQIIKKLEDEIHQLRQMTSVNDEAYKRNITNDMRKLINIKDNLYNYYGEDSDRIPTSYSEEDQCEYRRRRIFRMAGDSYGALYALRKKTDGEKTLLDIKTHLEANVKSQFAKAYDLQALISVKLILCSMNEQFRIGTSRSDMAKLSKELYEEYSNDENAKLSLEPFVYAVMLNWPQQTPTGALPIPIGEISEILAKWTTAYFEKYPRQREGIRPYRKKDTTIAFLGSGEGMKSLVFRHELPAGGAHGDNIEQFWVSDSVQTKFQRFRGTVTNDGYDVAFKIQQKEFKIPASLPKLKLNHRSVYFIIGFTWAGPKAYDVRLDDPVRSHITETPAQQPTSPALRRGTGVKPLVEREGRFMKLNNHMNYLIPIQNIQNELKELERRKKDGSQQWFFKQMDTLRIEREKLVSDKLKAIIKVHYCDSG